MANSIAVLALLLMSITTGVGAAAQATDPEITITPATAQKVISGSPDRFTGSVRVQSLFDPGGPSPTSGGAVTFQPGARSAWHTHPLGQILIATDGVGWIQQWGGPVQVIRKGDVVWIPPGVKHWHGATPTTSMRHIAVQNGQRRGGELARTGHCGAIPTQEIANTCGEIQMNITFENKVALVTGAASREQVSRSCGIL